MAKEGKPIHSHRQKLRAAVAENRRLVLQGRALLSDIDQGFAALKDHKAKARQSSAPDRVAAKLAPRVVPAAVRQVLLIEDHPVVSRGLAELINYEDDLHVCGVSTPGVRCTRDLSRARIPTWSFST